MLLTGGQSFLEKKNSLKVNPLIVHVLYSVYWKYLEWIL